MTWSNTVLSHERRGDGHQRQIDYFFSTACSKLTTKKIQSFASLGLFVRGFHRSFTRDNPDSKVHGANMGPTWVLPAPDGPHVGPMNLAIREIMWKSFRCHEVIMTSSSWILGCNVSVASVVDTWLKSVTDIWCALTVCYTLGIMVYVSGRSGVFAH